MRKLFTTIFFLIVAVATWAYDVEVDGIYYNLVTKVMTAEVTYETFGTSSYVGSITIPETIEVEGATYSVTSIGADAFWCCSSLSSVTIPKSITVIGAAAFINCTALTSVEIPNNVTSIGENALAMIYLLAHNYLHR